MRVPVRVFCDAGSWVRDFIPDLRRELAQVPSNLEVHDSHDALTGGAGISIAFGYSRRLPQEILEMSDLNVVIHASDLPRGRGWSPYIWDVLAGAAELTVSAIEASRQIDAGDILAQERIRLDGTELLPEIRREIALTGIRLVKGILEHVASGTQRRSPQVGDASYCRRRSPLDSRVDIAKSIEDQFDLFRVVDNEHYPAWFEMRGRRYRLAIFPHE